MNIRLTQFGWSCTSSPRYNIFKCFFESKRTTSFGAREDFEEEDDDRIEDMPLSLLDNVIDVS